MFYLLRLTGVLTEEDETQIPWDKSLANDPCIKGRWSSPLTPFVESDEEHQLDRDWFSPDQEIWLSKNHVSELLTLGKYL